MTQFLYEANHQTCDIGTFVGATWSENRKYKFSTVSLKDKQGHVTVFMIVIIEQCELLGTICVGIAIVEIQNDSFWFLLVRGNEMLDKHISHVV